MPIFTISVIGAACLKTFSSFLSPGRGSRSPLLDLSCYVGGSLPLTMLFVCNRVAAFKRNCESEIATSWFYSISLRWIHLTEEFTWMLRTIVEHEIKFDPQPLS